MVNHIELPQGCPEAMFTVRHINLNPPCQSHLPWEAAQLPSSPLPSPFHWHLQSWALWCCLWASCFRWLQHLFRDSGHLTTKIVYYEDGGLGIQLCELCSSKSQFLNFGTMGIWGHVILNWRELFCASEEVRQQTQAPIHRTLDNCDQKKMCLIASLPSSTQTEKNKDLNYPSFSLEAEKLVFQVQVARSPNVCKLSPILKGF